MELHNVTDLAQIEAYYREKGLDTIDKKIDDLRKKMGIKAVWCEYGTTKGAVLPSLESNVPVGTWKWSIRWATDQGLSAQDQDPEGVARIFGSVQKTNFLAHATRGIELDISKRLNVSKSKAKTSHFRIIPILSDQCRQACCLLDESGCTILINPWDSDLNHEDFPCYLGIRLVLAHELGHLTYNIDKIGEAMNGGSKRLGFRSYNGEEEVYAWRFARALVQVKSEEHRKSRRNPEYVYELDTVNRFLGQHLKDKIPSAALEEILAPSPSGSDEWRGERQDVGICRAPKLAQMAACLLRRNGGPMERAKLMRLMYLADREAMDRHWFPISDDEYYSMGTGPVLSMALDLMGGNEVGRAQREWDEWVSPMEGNRAGPRKEAADNDLDELADEEIDILEAVFDEFGGRSMEYLDDQMRSDLKEWRDPGSGRREIALRSIFEALGKPYAKIDAKLELLEGIKHPMVGDHRLLA
jgi:hypothetical protein